MSVELAYPDEIRLIRLTVDEYGDEVYEAEATVPAVFEPSTGWSHGSHQSAITSDAVAFVDPTDPFIQANYYRLEGMLVVSRPFDGPFGASWYRITGVDVPRDSQLGNQPDHVALALSKAAGLEGVS